LFKRCGLAGTYLPSLDGECVLVAILGRLMPQHQFLPVEVVC
jgi:hypothetical protein